MADEIKGLGCRAIGAAGMDGDQVALIQPGSMTPPPSLSIEVQSGPEIVLSSGGCPLVAADAVDDVIAPQHHAEIPRGRQIGVQPAVADRDARRRDCLTETTRVRNQPAGPIR